MSPGDVHDISLLLEGSVQLFPDLLGVSRVGGVTLPDGEKAGERASGVLLEDLDGLIDHLLVNYFPVAQLVDHGLSNEHTGIVHGSSFLDESLHGLSRLQGVVKVREDGGVSKGLEVYASKTLKLGTVDSSVGHDQGAGGLGDGITSHGSEFQKGYKPGADLTILSQLPASRDGGDLGSDGLGGHGEKELQLSHRLSDLGVQHLYVSEVKGDGVLDNLGLSSLVSRFLGGLLGQSGLPDNINEGSLGSGNTAGGLVKGGVHTINQREEKIHGGLVGILVLGNGSLDAAEQLQHLSMGLINESHARPSVRDGSLESRIETIHGALEGLEGTLLVAVFGGNLSEALLKLFRHLLKLGAEFLELLLDLLPQRVDGSESIPDGADAGCEPQEMLLNRDMGTVRLRNSQMSKRAFCTYEFLLEGEVALGEFALGLLRLSLGAELH